MNKTDALLIADKILALINSQPRTPGREEIAAAVETAIPQWTMADYIDGLNAAPSWLDIYCRHLEKHEPVSKLDGCPDEVPLGHQPSNPEWRQGLPTGVKVGLRGFDLPDRRGRAKVGRDDIGGQ